LRLQFCYDAEIVLKFPGLSVSPSSESPVTGTIAMCHQSWHVISNFSKSFTLSPWVGELGRLGVWNQFGWPSERLNKNSRRIISRKQSSYNFPNCSFWIKTFHLVLKFILCYTIERILFYMQVLLYLYFQVLAFKNILGKVKWGNSSLWNENNDNLTPWYFIK
jgi:hypothetical protein